VRIFGTIVEMAACLLASFVSNHLHCGVVRWALVSHHDFRVSIAFHGFSEEFQRCCLVPLLRDVRFQNLPFVVHRSWVRKLQLWQAASRCKVTGALNLRPQVRALRNFGKLPPARLLRKNSVHEVSPEKADR